MNLYMTFLILTSALGSEDTGFEQEKPVCNSVQEQYTFEGIYSLSGHWKFSRYKGLCSGRGTVGKMRSNDGQGR